MGTVHAGKLVYLSRQEMYPQKYWAFIKTLANGDTYVHFKLKYYICNLSLEENIGQAHKGEHSTGTWPELIKTVTVLKIRKDRGTLTDQGRLGRCGN